MKLLMTLLVRDEDDIIDENIRFHLAMGVEQFIVTDHLSRDSTPDILREHEKNGYLEIIEEKSDTYNQGQWVTSMARRAFTHYNAEWVIDNDADEFWMPLGGKLTEYLGSLPNEIYNLHVNRLDYVFREHGDIPFYEALIFREWMCKWTKCCHKGAADTIVDVGNHYATSSSFPNGKEAPSMNSMAVLHFPIRSYDRYLRKMELGSRAMLNTSGMPSEFGFHWKKAAEHIQKGTFDDFFSDKTYSAQRINDDIKSGALVIDDRLQRFFLNKSPT